jgi:hypothetical protein
MASAFTNTLSEFVSELRLTFPELDAAIDRAATVTPAHYWKSWQNGLEILAMRDYDRLLAERRGLIIGPVLIKKEVWDELSDGTRLVIWKYLRTLMLEAAMEIDHGELSTQTMQSLVDIMTAERIESGGEDAEKAASEMFEESMGHMKPLLDKLRGLLGSAANGGAGATEIPDIPLPEIPEHLRKGRIAQLAESMSKQISPEDFGLNPAELEGLSMEELLKRLAETYQRNPTLLLNGAKRVAEKIQKQVLNGNLKREELIAEVEEFIGLFKEHPLFKDAIEKFQSLTGGSLASMFGGGGGGAEQSERRRIVQERLRKKLAARKAAKK